MEEEEEVEHEEEMEAVQAGEEEGEEEEEEDDDEDEDEDELRTHYNGLQLHLSKSVTGYKFVYEAGAKFAVRSAKPAARTPD